MWAITLNFSVILIISSIANAAGIKIVPNGTTITYKDGVTHERNKYLIVPDSSDSNHNTATSIKSYASKTNIGSKMDQDNIDNNLIENRKKMNVKYIRIKDLNEPLKDAISKLKLNSDGSPSTNYKDLTRNSNLDVPSPVQKDEVDTNAAVEQFLENYGFRNLPGSLRFSTEYLNSIFAPEEAPTSPNVLELDPESEKFEFFRNGAHKSDIYNGLDYTWEPEKVMKNGKPRYSTDYLDYGRADVDELNALNEQTNHVASKYENLYSDAAEKYIGGYEPVQVVYPAAVKSLCTGPDYDIRECAVADRHQIHPDKQMKNFLSAKFHNGQRHIAYQPAVNEVVIGTNPIVPILAKYPSVGLVNAKVSGKNFNYKNNDRVLNYVVAKQPQVYLPDNGLLDYNQYYSNGNNQYDYLQKIKSHKNLNLNPVVPNYAVAVPKVDISSVPIYYNGLINNEYQNLINQKANKQTLDRNDALYNLNSYNFNNNFQIKKYDKEANRIAVNLHDSIFIKDIIQYLYKITQKYGLKIRNDNYNSLNVHQASRYELELKYNLKSLREFLTKVIVLPRADTVENVDLLYKNILKFIYYLDNIGISETHVFKLIEVIKKRVHTIVEAVSSKKRSDKMRYYLMNNSWLNDKY